MGAEGQFGALAAVNISANSAWFAWDLPLYINPNDAMQTSPAINLYGQITGHWIMQHRLSVNLNSRLYPSEEHLLQKKKKWCADTHTELHVGDRCSHRWKLHIHRWIGT